MNIVESNRATGRDADGPLGGRVREPYDVDMALFGRKPPASKEVPVERSADE